MKIYKEINLIDYEAYGSAKSTFDDLSPVEMRKVEEYLEEAFPEGMSDTDINDFIRDEDAFIYKLIGRKRTT